MSVFETFLARHPVFTVDQFSSFQKERGSSSIWTRSTILTRQEKKGRVLRVRRGLYAAVPFGTPPENASVDPLLVAALAAPDAVLAYHTAAEFHGKANSVFNEFQYLTFRTPRPWRFRDQRFRPVLLPKPLRSEGNRSFGVEKETRGGVEVAVTSLERTAVDLLDRLDLAGGFEEAWRFLEAAGFLHMEEVITYVRLLGNATTAARVGYCLERLRERLAVEELHLKHLEELRPRQPHYLDRKRKDRQKLMARWNLVVPQSFHESSWREEG